ncbi:hypothetical protein GGR52DRAFT_533299 [Hypoxylon sp. FL1284]|nr:hypothetical protein GGR52DRAFT_533299 [Hypoxylon sp. FL1284]
MPQPRRGQNQLYLQERLHLTPNSVLQIYPNITVPYTEQQRPPVTPNYSPNNILYAAHHENKVRLFASWLSDSTARKYLDRIRVPLPLSVGGGGLDILPQGVLNEICKRVPYEYLLRLYQQSRALHETIDPQLAPTDTKVAFVLRAERDFAQHSAGANINVDPPNMGCYACYRVLRPELFAQGQTTRLVKTKTAVLGLRRFCVHCGIRLGYHEPGKPLTMERGRAQWVCKCSHILPTRVFSCDECGCDVIMSSQRRSTIKKKVKRDAWNKRVEATEQGEDCQE